MSKKKKEHIKKFINTNSIDKAPANFTSNVMQDVFVLTNEAALKDATLSSLLKRTSVEKPSYDFASNIMTQLNAEKEIEYQPLISKKAWLIISVVVIASMLGTIFSNSTGNSASLFSEITPYIDQAKGIVNNPFKGAKVSPLLAISLLCLTSMLLFDNFLKKKLI